MFIIIIIIIIIWDIGYKCESNILVDILQIVWPQTQSSIRISSEKFLSSTVSTLALMLLPQGLQRTRPEVDQSL